MIIKEHKRNQGSSRDRVFIVSNIKPVDYGICPIKNKKIINENLFKILMKW